MAYQAFPASHPRASWFETRPMAAPPAITAKPLRRDEGVTRGAKPILMVRRRIAPSRTMRPPIIAVENWNFVRAPVAPQVDPPDPIVQGKRHPHGQPVNHDPTTHHAFASPPRAVA